MTRRIGAVATVIVMLACIVPTLALPIVHGQMLGLFGPDLGLSISFSVVGAFLLVRSPVTNLAVLMCVSGMTSSLTSLTIVGLNLAQLHGPPHGWGLFAAWLNYDIWIPGVTLLVPIILLFPDGRLASPIWRWPIVVATLTAAVFVFDGLFTKHSVIDGKPESFAPNRTGLFHSPALNTIADHLADLILACIIVSILSIIIRRRRADGVERAQLTSLIYGLSVSIVVLTVVFAQHDPLAAGPVLFTVGLFAIMPIAVSIAVAVLRYRLYEIDRIVSRTVTYAVVLALLAGVYFLVLGTVARAVPDNLGSLGVALATLLVTALAVPLTRRVRHVVDRRFDRARFDAEQVVAGFAARLRARPERGDVPADLLEVVQRTVAPEHSSIWLVRR